MKTEERIAAGVGLLIWVVMYLLAVTILLMDLLVWRPG